MKQLVLVRHGESAWNRENRFTGWVDVGLSEKGVEEARAGGRALRKEGFVFHVAFTSLLRRAIQTLELVLNELDLLWIPVEKSWRLNERHYGGLQGLNKAETARKHGDEQVKLWRRSYDVPPPPLAAWDPSWPGNDGRYPPGVMPATESLKDTVARVVPYWLDAIAPALLADRRVLVAAHGNSIRGLVKHLGRMTDEAIVGLEIPTGVPIVYDLDDQLRPLRHRALR